MKRPGFFEGVLVAVFASAFGAALLSMFSLVFGSGLLRFVITIVAFGYVTYLLMRSKERTGRIAVLSIWSMLALIIWFFEVTLPLYLFIHVGMLWLIRCLYYHAGFISALADLGLNVLSVFAALAAAAQTQSLFITLWCFFLVQALFVFIPVSWQKKSISRRTASNHGDDFERAHQVAETALRKLLSNN